MTKPKFRISSCSLKVSEGKGHSVSAWGSAQYGVILICNFLRVQMHYFASYTEKIILQIYLFHSGSESRFLVSRKLQELYYNCA